MKNYIAFTFVFVFALVHLAHGQDYTFRVLANKGANKVRKTGSTTPTSLKTGAKLSAGDEIIAVQGAYIGLVHKTGKTMELRSPGRHRITDLEGKVTTGTANVSSRYMGFVMSKINERGRTIKNTDYRKNMNATGSVERSIGAVDIKMLIKETKYANKVYGDKVTLKWEEVNGTSTYLITVKNIFNEILLLGESSSAKASLDLTVGKLAKERFFIVSVQSKDNPDFKSNDFGIQRIFPDQATEFTYQYTRLKSELQGDSPLNKVVLASFFEENKLYLDALTLYEEAVTGAPEVVDFKVMLEDFIVFNNLGN